MQILKALEETTNTTATEAVGKIETKMSILTSKFFFLNPEILEINELNKC